MRTIVNNQFHILNCIKLFFFLKLTAPNNKNLYIHVLCQSANVIISVMGAHICKPQTKSILRALI